MSTKIYEAYRFPLARLNDFTLVFNNVCRKSVIDLLKKYQIKRKLIRETRKKLFGENRKASKRYTNDDVCLAWQLAEWMEMSKTGRNDMLHMDCSFNVWIHEGWAYVIPYVANGIKLDQLLPKWCKFYGYWNNTDPQEGVSDKEWQERKFIWDKIALDDWNRIRLTHITLEMKMPHLIGMESLLKEIKEDDSWVSSIYSLASHLYWEKENAKKV